MRLMLALLICLSASPAFANDFTVDMRSNLHLGVSAFLGAGINSSLIATDVPMVSRILISTTGCMFVGVMKEYGMDARADMGDLFFDAVGCGLGIAISEGVAVTIGKNKAAISVNF